MPAAYRWRLGTLSVRRSCIPTLGSLALEGGYDELDGLVENVSTQVMFPEADHRPAIITEELTPLLIATRSLANLLPPPFCVCLRGVEMKWATVPKAAIHEDAYLLTSEHHVRRTAERPDRPAILSEPEAQAMKSAAKKNLWASVFSKDRLHASAHVRRRRGRSSRPNRGMFHARCSETC